MSTIGILLALFGPPVVAIAGLKIENYVGIISGSIVSILTVAPAEEILYRGYAVERLTEITGSYWVAGAISVLVFGIAHIPYWGLGAALTTVISGAILTAFFIWQRDLAANIIAHVVTDLMGLVVMPPIAQYKGKGKRSPTNGSSRPSGR